MAQFSRFSSVGQLCPTLCDPTNRSTPGLPVHHQLLEFTQTHVHRVGDAIQPSHPLSSPSPPAPNPSQHQSLFQWVNSCEIIWISYRVSKWWNHIYLRHYVYKATNIDEATLCLNFIILMTIITNNFIILKAISCLSYRVSNHKTFIWIHWLADLPMIICFMGCYK